MGSHMHSNRRRFLTRGVTATVAGFVTSAVRAVRGQTSTSPDARPTKDLLAYGQPSPFDDTIRRAPTAPTAITDTALTTPLQDLDGIITPSGLHFLMDHVNGIPDIDPKTHRLLMHGMVDRPLDVHDGRAEALPVGVARLLPRVQRQQPALAWPEQGVGPVGPRTNQLQ